MKGRGEVKMGFSEKENEEQNAYKLCIRQKAVSQGTRFSGNNSASSRRLLTSSFCHSGIAGHFIVLLPPSA
jgi:hypothetical protein